MRPVIEGDARSSCALADQCAGGARLFDEFLKLFQAGNRRASRLICCTITGCSGEMFPATDLEDLAKEPTFTWRFTHGRPCRTRIERVARGQVGDPDVPAGRVLCGHRVKELAEIRRSEEKMSESQALSLASYEIVCATAATHLHSHGDSPSPCGKCCHCSLALLSSVVSEQ